MDVPLVSAYIFMEIPALKMDVGDSLYNANIVSLKKAIALAKSWNSKMVRVMTFGKQMAIWGFEGAEHWVAYENRTWSHMLRLFEEPVRLAEENGIDLVFETAINSLTTSGYLARKLADDLKSRHVKVLWDPANTLFNTDIPFPDAYETLKGHIGHIHIKDMIVDIRKSTITACRLGEGDMAPYLEDIAKALKKDNYDGVVSLENFYRPENGTFEDGYLQSLGTLQRLFG